VILKNIEYKINTNMTNIKKLFVVTLLTALSTVTWAGDVTFVMGSIFDGNSLSFNVTSPVAATVSSNTSKGNAKDGKLGSDGHYFQIVLASNTFTAASINGYINTTDKGKNWAFQFSTDSGNTWSTEVTQANDGNKTAHDIAVSATIPNNANGFRVVRRAGTSTMVSSITLTIDGGGVTPPEPVAVTGVTLNKTSLSLEAGQDETLIATVAPSNADNKNISWSSSDNTVASVDQTGKVSAVSAGTATITVTTADGNKTHTCTVTVTAPSTTIPVTAIALNKTSTTITVGASETLTVSYTPTNANTGKAITWTSSNNNIATVNNGVVTAVAEGTATITAKSEGNFTATCAVTVQAGASVPSTGLTLHEPEVYEAKEIAGGYNADLVVVNQKEYEVYYINRDASGSKLAIATSNIDKANNICDVDKSTGNNTESKDGWIKIVSNGTGGDQNAAATAEYQTSLRSCKLTNTSHVLEMHIKGYDEFSFYGKDNNMDASKNRMFEVYIDDVKQTRTPSDYAVHRYSISSGEHVIRITGSAGAGDNKLCSFSLRIAQEPRTKYLKGNDSTQNVLQTTSPKPVYYYTKYNSQGETRLVWNGAEATGITLNIQGHGEVGDTLVLSGTAQCPVGTYHYNVISYFNGLPTRSVAGKLQVSSDLKAQNDTIIDAYQGEEMDEIIFRYYALSANDVHLQWTGATPAGITGSGNNGKFIISGTPTQTGTYTYIISVDGSQPITGKIEVKPLDLGNNPILFLYKNNLSYEHNDVFKYLTGKGKNLIARKAKNELRPMEQYNKYKWILISEDVDADNEEVLDVIRGASGLPVLNLKGFTYSEGRLGWGNPDNGSVDTTTNNGTKIFVQREDHPIFASFSGKKQGDAIQIFKAGSGQGVMPINVSKQQSLCLATGYTRDIDHYMSDGELQTAIHEVPASQRGGSKYICLPISGKAELTTDGQKLLDAIVTYLTTETSSSISLPELQINSFSIFGVAGKIDQNANTIEMAFNVLDYPNINLRAIVPTIKLADPKYTFVTPASGDTVNFQYSTFMPIEFVVSDYINKRVYNVTVTMYNPQGIDEVYTVGEWVNIFDVYGRKIATTNENIYTMDLPRGMYIVVTESGETIKIMR
jgi:uncharacterized protein YjdB